MVPWPDDARWSNPGVPSPGLPSSLLLATSLPLLLMLGALALRTLALSLAPVECVLTIVRTFPPCTVTCAPPHSLLVPVHLCIYWLPWPYQVLSGRVD